MYIYTSLRRTDSKKIKLEIKKDSFPFIWFLHFLERTKPLLLISQNSEHNKSSIVRIPAPGPAITYIISCSEETSMNNEIEKKKNQSSCKCGDWSHPCSYKVSVTSVF